MERLRMERLGMERLSMERLRLAKHSAYGNAANLHGFATGLLTLMLTRKGTILLQKAQR